MKSSSASMEQWYAHHTDSLSLHCRSEGVLRRSAVARRRFNNRHRHRHRHSQGAFALRPRGLSNIPVSSCSSRCSLTESSIQLEAFCVAMCSLDLETCCMTKGSATVSGAFYSARNFSPWPLACQLLFLYEASRKPLSRLAVLPRVSLVGYLMMRASIGFARICDPLRTRVHQRGSHAGPHHRLYSI